MSANDGVASWYTPGLVDGFGDRLLMFDNTETESLELLRFYPSLSSIAGFEHALHERVRQVGRIPDHAFPLIVAVERLEGDGTLALVSTHIPGKRLSVFFDRPGPPRGLSPSFVTGIVTQIVQAMTVLQSKGDDITHSALTPERIVVTTGGRVCVVEHVLGSALRQLNLSLSQLWREFGLVAMPDASGGVRLDARNDVFQLGVLALEMLLGRRLTPLDLKDRLPDLIDQWSVAVTRLGMASDRLRAWLERALQISDEGYATAADAYADLRDMPAESAASAFDSLTGDVDDIASRRALQPLSPVTVPQPMRSPISPADNRWPEPAPDPRTQLAASRPREVAVPEASYVPPAQSPTPAPAKQAAAAPAKNVSGRRTALKAPRVSPWVAAVLALIAIVEGAVIATLLMRQPSAVSAAAPPAPIAEGGGRPTPIPTEPVAAAAPPVRQETAPKPDPIAALANNQRSGGVRLQTPVELKVLQGDRVLGSSADGPIILAAGTYQLDFINTALGLRMRRSVTFRPGQIANLDVAPPPGRANFNAQPWAEVSIDNRVVGETPLANVSVPIGEHEVVFRHPDLGERRQTITVRADAPTRVSTSFEK
jgi:serine/threonine-protein kinase